MSFAVVLKFGASWGGLLQDGNGALRCDERAACEGAIHG
jgi:hypothetical protein